MKETPLTPEERELLEDCIRGADVWGYAEARLGRQLEDRGLIKVVKARHQGDGRARLPYYGAITTAAGRRALKEGVSA